ncbi:MAG: hypothetical protein HQL86_09470 [Magnetococcales bacterium]|nr:hypothetical protein [Magnetococcales bacterium]
MNGLPAVANTGEEIDDGVGRAHHLVLLLFLGLSAFGERSHPQDGGDALSTLP